MQAKLTQVSLVKSLRIALLINRLLRLNR